MRRRRLAPIALGALLPAVCTALCFFSFAEVLFVAQFKFSTNEDYSDAMQALQRAVMPLPRRATATAWQAASRCERLVFGAANLSVHAYLRLTRISTASVDALG